MRELCNILSLRRIAWLVNNQLLLALVVALKPIIYMKPLVLFWEKPPTGFVAHNINGDSKGNFVAGVGVFRDVAGIWLGGLVCFSG